MTETDQKIELLKKIARRFHSANITWALGASMLLYFKKITTDFHDIDLMIVDDDVDAVRTILSEMGELQPPNPNARYQTKTFMEFVIDSVDVDVMAGFCILHDGKCYDCSLKEEQIVEWLSLDGESIPLQSPRLWHRYYKLMGREDKAEMIENALSSGQFPTGE